MIRRFDIFLVELNPALGHEMQKQRPCVVVSPHEMNAVVETVIVAPLTSRRRSHYPFRVDSRFDERDGQIVLDQIRAVDKRRLTRKLGQLSDAEQSHVLQMLAAIFAP